MTPLAYIIIAAITATAAAVITHLALLLKRWNQTSDEYLALLHNIADALDRREKRRTERMRHQHSRPTGAAQHSIGRLRRPMNANAN